jgi:hypothetical protein
LADELGDSILSTDDVIDEHAIMDGTGRAIAVKDERGKASRSCRIRARMGDTDSVSDDLVRFFETLPPEARAAYEELAERDRRWGEDAAGERAS